MAKKKPFDLHNNEYYKKGLFDIDDLKCEKEFWNVDVLKRIWEQINSRIYKYNNYYSDTIMKILVPDIDEQILDRINKATDELVKDADFFKWFSEDILRQLYIIKDTLLELEYTREREFFDLAFFAIIRCI